MSSFAERDTNAPTLSFIFSQVMGLQQLLNLEGIHATSVQQVDELLSDSAYLIAAGYLRGASINLVPVRTQVGGTVDWSTRGAHKRDLSYSFLYNDNQALQGSTEEVVHTLSLTQSITRSDNLALSCSILELKNPRSSDEYTPLCYIAWRHQFQHVPYFVIPERRGTITGNVFRDDQSRGEFEPGMPPLPEVEVMLDDRRRTLTIGDGSYRFPNVSRGKHKIEAIYSSRAAFFFTTPSSLEVEEDATVNFGIGYTLSGLMGRVVNDAGQGVAAVNISIESRGKKWSASTEGDGAFFISSLVAGDYAVQADEDSLPPGYAAGAFGEPRNVTVGASSPGRADFTVRALRSISGTVLGYNRAGSRYVPVPDAPVDLLEPGLTGTTDSAGRYLFRDLAAGTFTISVQTRAGTLRREVQLGAQPVDLGNVDFKIGQPASPEAPAAPPPLPVTPAPLVANLPAAPTASPALTAQQHNLLGRQLTKAGQYREATIELDEALRLAPDFALALNARGYALFMLHEWRPAIADLDRAISLNSNYADACHIRALVKRAIRDTAGADADSKRAQELAH